MEVDRHARGKWLEPVTVITAEMMVFLHRDGGTQKTVIMHTMILIFQEWQKTQILQSQRLKFHPGSTNNYKTVGKLLLLYILYCFLSRNEENTIQRQL